MTINQLLDKCRENAVKVTNEFYFDICDGEDVAEELQNDKITGEYYMHLERFTMDSIYTLIRTIKNTKLMNDSEKEEAVKEIKGCPEYKKVEENVANILINHFKRNIDVYRTM